MSWRDIDIVLQLKDDTQKVKKLFNNVFTALINKDRIIKIYYIDTIHSHHKKGMPKGLCLGFDIHDQSLNPDCSEVINNKWKIDMWILECKHFRKNRNFDHNLKLKLNSENQKRIINLKFELMNGSLNMPILSSYYIYSAVLLKNMTNDKEITKYVKSKILK